MVIPGVRLYVRRQRAPRLSASRDLPVDLPTARDIISAVPGPQRTPRRGPDTWLAPGGREGRASGLSPAPWISIAAGSCSSALRPHPSPRRQQPRPGNRPRRSPPDRMPRRSRSRRRAERHDAVHRVPRVRGGLQSPQPPAAHGGAVLRPGRAADVPPAVGDRVHRREPVPGQSVAGPGGAAADLLQGAVHALPQSLLRLGVHRRRDDARRRTGRWSTTRRSAWDAGTARWRARSRCRPTSSTSRSMPRVRKCELCTDRAKGTGANPACAASCPTEALVFGRRADLVAMAKERIARRPDRYVNHLYGEHEVGRHVVDVPHRAARAGGGPAARCPRRRRRSGPRRSSTASSSTASSRSRVYGALAGVMWLTTGSTRRTIPASVR